MSDDYFILMPQWKDGHFERRLIFSLLQCVEMSREKGRSLSK